MATEQKPKYWSVKAEAGTGNKVRATVLFYGDISFYPNWYEEDKSALEIAEELKAAGEIEHITARINSPGGSAFGGLAIANLLKSWPAPVTTHVDGLAGSAASLIFAAGDERIMPGNTLLFIHNPLSWSFGYASDMRKAADELDTIREALVSTYTEATGLDADKVRELMDGETWLSAAQAKELNFATSIDRIPVAACAHGARLVVNGLDFDPTEKRLPLTDEARAALLTAEAQAAAEQVTPLLAGEGQGEGSGVAADTEQDTTQEAGRSSEAIDSTMDGENSAEEAAATADDNAAHGDDATAAASPATPEPQNTPLLAGEGQGEGSGVDTTADTERERIRAITELAERIPGSAALAHRACFDEPMSVEAFAVAAHTDPAVIAARNLAARAADAAIINQIPPAGVPLVEETSNSAQTINKKYWPYSQGN